MLARAGKQMARLLESLDDAVTDAEATGRDRAIDAARVDHAAGEDLPHANAAKITRATNGTATTSCGFEPLASRSHNVQPARAPRSLRALRAPPAPCKLLLQRYCNAIWFAPEVSARISSKLLIIWLPE